MEVYLIIKIAVVGLLISLLNQILKQADRSDLAYMTGLAGLVLVLFWLLPYITNLFQEIKGLLAL